MNDNDSEHLSPTPRTLRMAGTIRFWIEQDMTIEQMRAKLALQYGEATPHEIEHAVLMAQAMIIADEESSVAKSVLAIGRPPRPSLVGKLTAESESA